MKFLAKMSLIRVVWLLAFCIQGSNALRIATTRRGAIITAAAALPFIDPSLARAIDDATAPAAIGLKSAVERTLKASDQNRAPVRYVQQLFQGLDAADVYYPEWFSGKWRASSKLVQVLAPAGPEVFSPGRNGSLALANAREGVGDVLAYDVRWVKLPSGQLVVDREYNLASITRASMGGRAVQDIQTDGPDKCSLYIQPSAAPGSSVFRAELRVIGRRTEPAGPEPAERFDCAEVVRQTIVVVPGEKADTRLVRAPQVKEVETICTYELEPRSGIMRGYQRTATFLAADASYTSGASLAEQSAVRLASGPGGRQVAIDVRTYEIVYERV